MISAAAPNEFSKSPGLFSAQPPRTIVIITEARIAGIRALPQDAAPELGDGTEATELSTADGYRVWSATYDQPGNPLTDVEQPHHLAFPASWPLIP